MPQALVAAKILGQTGGVHVMSKGALGWSARSDRIHLGHFIKAGCLKVTIIHEDEYQVSWRVVAIVRRNMPDRVGLSVESGGRQIENARLVSLLRKTMSNSILLQW